MEVMNCKGCKKLFNYMGGLQLCAACKDELEKKFVKVKEYIYQNPHCSMAQVAEDNDVTVKQIKQWIREERLVLSDPTVDGIECEHCGVPICSGRFCDKCKAAMASEIGSVIAKPKKIEPEKKPNRDGDKMRFLQK